MSRARLRGNNHTKDECSVTIDFSVLCTSKFSYMYLSVFIELQLSSMDVVFM